MESLTFAHLSIKANMKYLLLAPVVLFAMAFAAEEKEHEQNPENYSILYCKNDASVPKGTAKVEFTFRMEYGVTVRDSVLLSYNGIGKTVKPDQFGRAEITLPAGKYAFQFYYMSDYMEIYTDSILLKSGCKTGINVVFENSRIPVIAEKPVIYVYPEHTMDINIQLNVNGELGFTYPKYNNGWNVNADPDGTIRTNGKTFDYLFWDAATSVNLNSIEEESGFILKRDSLSNFFETQLTAMGLNSRERQDFITYWCPLMQKNETSYIHFMFNEEYSSIATLNVTPKPDNIFRVFMVWSDATEIDAKNIHPQTVEIFKRTGSTVVEWGGAEAKQISEVL